MNIQLITGNKNLKSYKNITVSDYFRPLALDDFDINVIDLSAIELWRNDGDIKGDLNNTNDLFAISKMVDGSNKTKIIYVFPQDGDYLYFYRDNKFIKREKIKNIICYGNNKQCFLYSIPFDNILPDVVFECTTTTIDNKQYFADFHFEYDCGNAITKSDKSEKITTFMLFDNLFFTTLNICNSMDNLEHFIKAIFYNNDISDIPEWVKEYHFGDDTEQIEIINNNKEKIRALKIEIEHAEERINLNNKYKSILYTNGQKLVDVVFEILELLLDYDLSDFQDEKREDFLIKKGKHIFIGEIKGVTTNVKNEFISQLDVHCQSYIDDLNENQKNEEVHGLLIINPFRTKKLEVREPVNEKQISLAKRNKSLIIETSTLLRIFELYISNKISSDEVINVLSKKTGLLSVDDLKLKIN